MDEFEMDDDYGVDHYASDDGGVSDDGGNFYKVPAILIICI